ncbi:WXG100 family type VII secretion target [Mycolicibacterium smegmatis]|uniref:WXG100 family type VII secretion target n=1 Tax=Mycolicibacterium smegmatis TaxID=1772 RepID=UPI001303ACA3|nr:hypothetical protein [Mycolicibacterium smegmatis]
MPTTTEFINAPGEFGHRTPPAPDAGQTIETLNYDLGEYLNRPVRDILASLGLTSPVPHTDVSNGQQPNPDSASGGDNSGIDPTQMIKPVTDALGTLGSGQFDDENPPGMLDGISSALEDTAGNLMQALSDVDGMWQGDAATAAMSATRTAMDDGAEVAAQAQNLRMNLLAAVTAVQQARARLIEIIGEFWATIAAIGPNIIFPWGMAAAIEAAMRAVTEASEIMIETQGTMTGAAAKVSTDGIPVNISKTAQPAGIGTPGGSSLSPVSSLVAPALQSLSALPGTPSGSGLGSGNVPQGAAVEGPTAAPPVGVSPSPSSTGSGHGGGAVPRPAVARLVAPPVAQPVASAEGVTPEPVPGQVRQGAMPGGGPMAGGAPLGHHAGAGTDGKHTAAAYLHTATQGEQVVGRAADAAGPPVVGDLTTSTTPDIELRI